MDTEVRTAGRSALYSPDELTTHQALLTRRWVMVAVPCLLFAAGLVFAVIIRNEPLSIICTCLIGAILIFCHDFFIKPVSSYVRHLNNVLNGRVREIDLPFHALSEDMNLVDGVSYHSLTCVDIDGKGRPYERLFYIDALKTIPDFKEGEMVHIVHHDLVIANITHA